jgi:rhamnosyltransferase
MRISVAMTTRNGERWIEPLLESLAAQTRLPDELVVHDDASDDRTVAMVASFAERAPFAVKFEQSESRRGHVEGFLRAAELCSGDVIAFCDNDDVWLEHKLARCESALAESGAELVLHTVRVVDEQLRDVAPPWPAIGPSRCVERLGLTGLAVDAPGMALVFRRRVLEVADPATRPPSRFGLGRQMLHDEWALFLAGVLGPVQLLDEPLLLYRQHGGNDTGYFERTRQRSLRPALDDYQDASDHYAACASYLDAAAAGAGGAEVAKRLEDGARYYAEAAAIWGARVELYGAPDRRTRARLVRRLVGARAYRPTEAGGFGRVALGKDVIGGVALRTAAPREGDPQSA